MTIYDTLIAGLFKKKIWKQIFILKGVEIT